MRNAFVLFASFAACIAVASCTYERRPGGDDGGGKPDLWMPLFPDCMDKFKNQDETDIDCGGSCMKKCAEGQMCKVKADCANGGLCLAGVCTSAAICTNGLKDGDESDVDCGGSCPGCGFDKACKAPTDCKSGSCVSGRCAPIKAALAAGKGINIGAEPVSALVADVDGDKTPDFVALSGSVDKIHVVLGRADQKYTMPVAISCPKGEGPDSLTAGDIDGDGKIDLAVTTGGMALVLQNDTTEVGKPVFKMPKALNMAGTAPTSPRLVDLNRDGKLDLVTVDAEYDFNNNGYYFYVATNGGNMTWQGPRRVFAGGDMPVTPAFADMNDDGITDFIGLTGSTVSVGIGKGDGSFNNNFARSMLGTFTGRAIALGDFDPDGRTDVVVIDRADAIGIMAGYGDGTLTRAIKAAAPSTPAALVVADFDLDDKLDAATLDGFNDNVELFLGQGGRKLTASVSVMAGTSPNTLFAADVNLDGKVDLVTTNTGSDQLTVLLNASK